HMHSTEGEYNAQRVNINSYLDHLLDGCFLARRLQQAARIDNALVGNNVSLKPPDYQVFVDKPDKGSEYQNTRHYFQTHPERMEGAQGSISHKRSSDQ